MSLLRLFPRSSLWIALVAAAAGLVAGAGGVGLIGLIQHALTPDGLDDRRLPWAFAGLCLVLLLARVTSNGLLVRLAQRSVFHLHVTLGRAIAALPQRQHEVLGDHRLLANLTEDVPAIANALLGLPVLCVNAAILVSCLAYMGWLSPVLLAGVIGFLAVGVASYQLPVWAALGHLHRARLEHDALMKCFRGLIEGAKELKVHGARRHAFLEEHMAPTAARLRDRNSAGLTIYAAAGTWGQLLFVVCIGLLLFAPHGPARSSRAILSGYIMTILFCIAPIENILAWLPILGRARAALRAIDDLDLSANPGEPERSAQAQPPDFQRLEFHGVTHVFRGGADDGFALGPIDLSLVPGEVVFIVGGNGSGKTTLAKLVVGLYAPASGEVRLNGEPVLEADHERYRQLFSVVFADAHVFEHLLGMDDDDLDARARGYLDRLDLAHKVRVEEGTLSTTELSHGQRKRLALLTALLDDRPVYVFDEWAADQDPRFKALFYTRLLPELRARGKAVLVISHDDHFFHLADTLIKLDYGLPEASDLAQDPAFWACECSSSVHESPRPACRMPGCLAKRQRSGGLP